MYIKECRMCHGKRLYKFLNLGATPPADQFLNEEQLNETDVCYPLNVVTCEDCGLTQLDYTVAPEILYCRNYPYVSSTTSAGQRHWCEFATTTTQKLDLNEKDLVVDIGSNVGVLLSYFKKLGTRILGVDPASNIAAIAKSSGIDTIASFFNKEIAEYIKSQHGVATVITATNVFAHVEDLDSLMNAVKALLKEDGVFVVEAPYLVDLIQNNEYDTIYHEHLTYLSLRPLCRFLHLHGMQIFDVQRRDIHGGSFRFFAQRQDTGERVISPIVDMLLKLEDKEGIYDKDRLDQFAKSVEKNRSDLRDLLGELKKAGKTIAAVSAPAKGMTLLNFCGIDRNFLDFVTEKTDLKIGKYTPGGHIPVLKDDALYERMPDYALLLAWNFAEEIMENLKAFSDGGGKFIIPIPFPRIVG